MFSTLLMPHVLDTVTHMYPDYGVSDIQKLLDKQLEYEIVL